MKVPSDHYGIVAAWLDERCKGHEVRATFHLDLIQGRAQAFIDHYYAADRSPDGFTSWHGESTEVTPGANLRVVTDWVRVTSDHWQSRRDEHAHPYEAMLYLPQGARAQIHSLHIEARPLQ